MKHFFSILFLSALAFGQTAPAIDTASIPTYFSTTGMRYSYYDRAVTETTNIGIRITSSQIPSAPKGLWFVTSIDASPRSAQVTSAAIRFGGRYYLNAIAGGNLIVHANIQDGAAFTAASAAPTASAVGSVLNNLAGGLGFTWRACHTFNPASKINCIADVEYELNSISTQAVKPIVGFYVGLTF